MRRSCGSAVNRRGGTVRALWLAVLAAGLLAAASCMAQADVTDFSTFQYTYEPDPPMMRWPFGIHVGFDHPPRGYGEVSEVTGGSNTLLYDWCGYYGCSMIAPSDYSDDYAHPPTRTFKIRFYDGGSQYAEDTLVVHERRLHFPIEADFDSSPGDFFVHVVGGGLGSTLLDTVIYEDGREVRRCNIYWTSCLTGVTSGAYYYAAVEDPDGNLYGITATYRATSSTTGVKETADQIDLPRLGALFASTSDVCTTLLTFPYGSHLANESPTDQWIACDTAVTNRLSMTALLQAVAAAGTGTTAVLWWLEHQATVQVLSLPTIPWPETEVPPIPDLPQVWQGAAMNLADYFKTQARGRDWPQATAEAIAAACLWNASRASLDGLEACRSLPIFITGADVAEATDHDLEAIAGNPAWVMLNYEASGAKNGSRSWYRTVEPCDVAGRTGQQCDEYPFWASEQGGPLAPITPSLKYIDGDDNIAQGSIYGAFVTSCGLRTGTPHERTNATGGTAFLVVPVPSIPSTYLCN